MGMNPRGGAAMQRSRITERGTQLGQVRGIGTKQSKFDARRAEQMTALISNIIAKDRLKDHS